MDPRIGAEAFLAAVLDCVAQPVWVVDHDGLVCFANPAAMRTLGYERTADVYGRASHALIHHHRPDGTPYPAALPSGCGGAGHPADGGAGQWQDWAA